MEKRENRTEKKRITFDMCNLYDDVLTNREIEREGVKTVK